MDKFELIGCIMEQINGLTVSGVRNCKIISQLSDEIACLRDGLQDEDKHHRDEIALLSHQIEDLTTPHPQEGETVVGGQVYKIGDEANGN